MYEMGRFRKCSVQVSCPLLPSISSDFKAAKLSSKLSFLEVTYAPKFYIDDPLDLDAWNLLWTVIKANLLREELRKGGAGCVCPTAEAPQSEQQVP